MPLQPKKELVIVIGGFNSQQSSYQYLKQSILEKYPNAEISLQSLPLHLFSSANPNYLVNMVVKEIDKKMDSIKSKWDAAVQ